MVYLLQLLLFMFFFSSFIFNLAWIITLIYLSGSLSMKLMYISTKNILFYHILIMNLYRFSIFDNYLGSSCTLNQLFLWNLNFQVFILLLRLSFQLFNELHVIKTLLSMFLLFRVLIFLWWNITIGSRSLYIKVKIDLYT